MNVKKCTQSNRHHYTFHDSRDRGGKVAKKSHKYCLKEGGGGYLRLDTYAADTYYLNLGRLRQVTVGMAKYFTMSTPV